MSELRNCQFLGEMAELGRVVIHRTDKYDNSTAMPPYDRRWRIDIHLHQCHSVNGIAVGLSDINEHRRAIMSHTDDNVNGHRHGTADVRRERRCSRRKRRRRHYAQPEPGCELVSEPQSEERAASLDRVGNGIYNRHSGDRTVNCGGAGDFDNNRTADRSVPS